MIGARHGYTVGAAAGGAALRGAERAAVARPLRHRRGAAFASAAAPPDGRPPAASHAHLRKLGGERGAGLVSRPWSPHRFDDYSEGALSSRPPVVGSKAATKGTGY